MPIRTRPTTDNLYWRFQYKGRTYEKSMETASRREAQERGMAWEVKVKGEAVAPALSPTIAVLRDLDLARAQRLGANPHYISDGLGSSWKHLVAYFGDRDLRALDSKALEEYIRFRKAVGRGQTIKRETMALKRALALAGMGTLVTVWPTVKRSSRNPKQASKRHTLEAWQHWLGSLPAGPAFETALFALLTGMRWGELYRARPEHVAEVEGGFMAIEVQERKVDREHMRQVVLSPLALLLVDLGCLPFPSMTHEKARRWASGRVYGRAKGTQRPLNSINLRDCRSAFSTVASSVVLKPVRDMLMGHSGVPALYQQEDYVQMARVAFAVQHWITGTAGRASVISKKVEKWLSIENDLDS